MSSDEVSEDSDSWFEYYPDEDYIPIEEHVCPCGYYCFDCLGISWHDFM